jgi:alkylresorcinol/alkylpyrone synthase/polyketide synthase Type III
MLERLDEAAREGADRSGGGSARCAAPDGGTPDAALQARAPVEQAAVAPRILSVGTAVPPRRYSQQELADLFALSRPRIRRLFLNSHIKHRHLVLPEPGPGGMPDESIEALNRKHRHWSLKVGGEAMSAALEPLGLRPADIDFLVCVTTTGYLCPGLTARFIQQFEMRDDIARMDIVGMGCNAALNALQPACAWARANPGRNVLMVCVEICSAAYVHNDSIESAVVNSLFGDAAAAVVIRAPLETSVGPAENAIFPSIVDFASLTLVDAIETMRFDLDGGKLSFFLDRDIPYVIGANCQRPVDALLARAGLRRRDIAHWIIHSGGKKVIDSVKINLDLTDHDVRHTVHVLENFGNISSCACLFSLARLVGEGAPQPGDHGVLMAMGPGAAIETARLCW